MSWRERLAQTPELADLQHWPAIELTRLSAEARSAFLRNQRAVAMTLAGEPRSDVCEAVGLSRGRITQLLERCLGGDLSEPPLLTAGLISHRRKQQSVRVKQLPQARCINGASCAFSGLLSQVPHVQQGLDEAILDEIKGKRHAQRLTPQHLHKLFMRLLTEINWPRDRYPFTSASCAYESVRRYLHHRRLELRQAAPKEQRVVLTQQTGTDHRALKTIQIDTHTLDLHTSIAVQFNDELIDLRMSRCSLLLAIDLASECVLGFHVCPGTAPGQSDLLALLDASLKPRSPHRPSTASLSALPEHAFPVERDPAPEMSFETVQFDNAWVHHSHAVSDFLTRRMGATLSFGLPAQPKTRALVERTFKDLERHFGHRVDSTTGSHPTDPRRESRRNSKTPPLLTYQSLIDALYLVLGAHNQRPKAHLGGSAPLTLFEYQLANHWRPPPPAPQGAQWAPFSSVKTLKVKRLTTEHRAPFVNFYHCRYSGPALSRLSTTVKEIRVLYDERDIRHLQAQTLDGRSLGVLSVHKSWLRFAHSLQTRRYLIKRQRAGRAQTPDPLTDYFLSLARQRHTPTAASELLRVYLEFSQEGRAALSLGATDDERLSSLTEFNAAPSSSTRTSPVAWSPVCVSDTEEI